MQRIFKTLSMLIMFFALSFVTANVACAETYTISHQVTYEDSSIYPRKATYTFDSNIVILTINETDHEIPIGDAYDITMLAFDSYGTLWVVSEYDIFCANYELEGEDIHFHYFAKGDIFFKCLDDKGLVFEEYVSEYGGPYFFYDLPTLDELKKLLDKENATPTPNSTFTPTPTPNPTFTPTPTPKPLVSPSAKPINTPISTNKPSISSDKNSNISSVFNSAQDDSKTDLTPISTDVKFAKVKNSGNKVKLLDSSGNAVKTVSFNKKNGVLTYKKKVPKVKDVYFTRKGTIVYLTKNRKAYYFNGKKSTLIKKNVTKVVTDSNKFAISLKLKNGKSFKLKK